MFTYIYAKAGGNSGGTETSDSAGPVTVHYQTTAGTKLAADEVITGSRDATYQTKAKTIAGYALQRVVGTATSSQGRLRYRLVNGSYVTARADYVANLYWQGKHYRKLVVINPKGTYEYRQPVFKRNYRVKLLHKKTVVKVKRLVRRGDMTRYQLTNGRYLNGNKQWVSVK